MIFSYYVNWQLLSVLTNAELFCDCSVPVLSWVDRWIDRRKNGKMIYKRYLEKCRNKRLSRLDETGVFDARKKMVAKMLPPSKPESILPGGSGKRLARISHMLRPEECWQSWKEMNVWMEEC